MVDIPKEYRLAKSVWEFVDVSPYEYEEGYLPLYGLEYIILDADLESFTEHKLDTETQDKDLEELILNERIYVKNKS